MKKFLIVFVIILSALAGKTQSKKPIKYSPGGEEIKRFEGMLYGFTVKVTSKAIYSGDFVYKAPPGVDIVDARFKLVGYNSLIKHEKDIILVLLSNGSVLELTESKSTAEGYEVNELDELFIANYNFDSDEILGDDLYVMTYDGVFVSDSGYNWKIDTIGLGHHLICNDIDIDTNEKVWLCCSNGLFSQELNVTTWVENTNYKAAGCDIVFIDRAQNIWVSYFNTIKVSYDGGKSFQNAPSGLYTGYIRDIADDAFGNIYVMWDNRLYYSKGGKQPFVRIDQPVTNDFALFPTTNIFNDIAGDTLIYFSTDAGLYTSANQGANWTYDNSVRAEHINSVASTKDSRLLMTTNTGLYRMEKPDNWTKRYPTNGFTPNTKVFTASNDEIYLLSEISNKNTATVPVNMVYKSTDNGNTFLPDTLGVKGADVAMSKFMVDETGVQHAAAIASKGNALLVWKKLPGQPWAIDTSGLPAMNFNYFVDCIGTDNSGKVYIAIGTKGITTVYSRPIISGKWVKETVINGSVFSLKGRKNVATIASSAGVSYNNGSGWKTIPRPAGVSSYVDWCLTEVDNNRVIWAYYEVFDKANIGEGIYFTSDYTNWNNKFANIDTILFGELYAIGDSVFAITSGNDGVYVFDTTINYTSQVDKVDYPDQKTIVSPNPFSTETSIKFKLKKESLVKLTIYNLLGEIVYQIPAQEMNTGEQELKVQLPQEVKGVLIFELKTDDNFIRGRLLNE